MCVGGGLLIRSNISIYNDIVVTDSTFTDNTMYSSDSIHAPTTDFIMDYGIHDLGWLDGWLDGSTYVTPGVLCYVSND